MISSARPRSTLSILDGVAMVVGIVIGIGIFKAPQVVALNVESEFAFIAMWVAGGLATLIGALCYAELATTYPSTGGEYSFLNRAYGPKVGILFAWARTTVIQTGAIAAVAFVFGDYAQAILPLGPYGPAIYGALSVIALTLVNLSGTHPTKNAQIWLTAATFIAIAIVAVAGLLVPVPEAVAAAPDAAAAGANGASTAAMGLALVFVLLTYGGWNEAAYLSAEMRDRRAVVWVLVLGVAAIAALYVLVNLAYLRSIGLEGLRASEVAAADLMAVTLGSAGALVLSVVICIEALSTMNATIFTGARVYHAVGRDLQRLKILSDWSESRNAPRTGILLQAAICLGLIIFGATTRGGFTAMVEYTAPVFWAFLFLVGLSLFLMRRREPDRERPFRVPLYPVVPALFCAICLYLLYSSLVYTGLGALIGVGVLLLGTPLLLLKPAPPASDIAEPEPEPHGIA